MKSVTISHYAMHGDIPEEAWHEAKVVDGKNSDESEICHFRIEFLWWYLSHLTLSGTNILRLKYLIKVAEIVLVMPHAEHLLSIVKQKKTHNRSSLKLVGTLSSILM